MNLIFSSACRSSRGRPSNYSWNLNMPSRFFCRPSWSSTISLFFGVLKISLQLLQKSRNLKFSISAAIVKGFWKHQKKWNGWTSRQSTEKSRRRIKIPWVVWVPPPHRSTSWRKNWIHISYQFCGTSPNLGLALMRFKGCRAKISNTLWNAFNLG